MTARYDEDEFDELSWEAREALDDPEGPQARDLAGQDEAETDTLPCPHCGRLIAEFTERCPHCGDWVVPGAGSRSSGPNAAVAIIALLLAIALVYLLVR